MLNLLQIKKSELASVLVDFWSVRSVKIYLGAVLACNLFLWFIAWRIISTVNSDMIALHYNIDFGIDYFGSARKVFIIPLLGFFIFFINIYVAVNLRRKKDWRFLSHVLFSISLICNLVLAASIISIYQINFR